MHMLAPSYPPICGIPHRLHLRPPRWLGQPKFQTSFQNTSPTANVPSVYVACSATRASSRAHLQRAHRPANGISMKRDSPSKDGTNLPKDESAPSHEGKRARAAVVNGPIMGTGVSVEGGASLQLSLSDNQLDMVKAVSALNATPAIPIQSVESAFVTKEFEQDFAHAGESGESTSGNAVVSGNGGITEASNESDVVVANEGVTNGGEGIVGSGGGAAVENGDGASVDNGGRVAVENGDAGDVGTGPVAVTGDGVAAVVANHGTAAVGNGHHHVFGNGGLPLIDAQEENQDEDNDADSDVCDESEVDLDQFFVFNGDDQQVTSLRRRFARGIPGRNIAEQLEGAANNYGNGAANGRNVTRGGHRLNRQIVGNGRRVHANGVGNHDADESVYGFGPIKDRADRHRFVERYNFDIVNDRPLKGRYHWVPIDEELPGIESSNGANGVANGFHTPGSPSSPRTPTSPTSVVNPPPAPANGTESTPTTSATDSADDHDAEAATAEQVLRVQANGRDHGEVQA